MPNKYENAFNYDTLKEDKELRQLNYEKNLAYVSVIFAIGMGIVIGAALAQML